ncbi:MAG: DUF4928 family protein [Ottowia sp.]
MDQANKAALELALQQFRKNKRFSGKGALCVALIVTQHARKGLPLNKDDLLTGSGGQVLGLGKDAVQAVLKRHDIPRILAAEGGRTSRGSIGNMREYADFLNAWAQAHPALNAQTIAEEAEKFWVACVREFFAAGPFQLRRDNARSLRMLIRDVMQQAQERQRGMPGMQYAGAVLQHLVGAKLDCALGKDSLKHHSFSTSDAQTGRAGDFFIGESVALHVTVTPGEAVIDRCRQNLDEDLRPVIVTTARGLAIAEGLAEQAGLDERIDVFEAEQFIALNLYELGKFTPQGRHDAVQSVVNRYNEIVQAVETDPSLQIELRP